MSTTADNAAVKATTLAGWKKSADHIVRCPSGVYVGIRIPDLPAMIEAGQIPAHLVDAAIGAANRSTQTPTRELIAQQREFTDKLVELTVVEPKISEEDAKSIPYEDKEMLVEIATRQRDLDAEGSHIGGLDKSEKFRRFRGLSDFESDLESV